MMEPKYSEQINAKIAYLMNELNDLKLLFEIPRLYIYNLFNDIRNEIDIAVNEKIIKERGSFNEPLISNWLQMIDIVYSFEYHCLKNFKNNKFSPESSKSTQNVIESIEFKLNLLTIQLDNIDDIETELDNLDDQIYDEAYKLQKIIFMNKTLAFFDEKNCKIKNYFGSSGCVTGKLVIIKNEYFGKRGLFSIKNSKNLKKSFLKRLTNEVIKGDRLRKIIQEIGTTNQIEEINLDNHIFEINYHYVKTLHQMAFHNLTNITVIDLSDNELTEVNAKIFDSLTSLTLIDLSHNNLTVIHAELFKGLTNLAEIYLHGNNLREVDQNLFKGLEHLAVISLHDNQISELHPKLFNELYNLTSINLSFNLLKEIDVNLFKGLSNLSYIDLSMNQLKTLDSDLVNGLTNLHRIFTFDNQLTLNEIAPNLMEFIQDFI